MALTPWPMHRRDRWRRSFGLSGTSAHVVVESYRALRRAPAPSVARVLVPLSARAPTRSPSCRPQRLVAVSPAGHRGLARRHRVQRARGSLPPPASRGGVGGLRDDRRRLQAVAAGTSLPGIVTGAWREPANKVAFVFPGQIAVARHGAR